MKTSQVTLIAALLTAPLCCAQQIHQHEAVEQTRPAPEQPVEAKGPHGGAVQTVGGLSIESLVEPEGIRVFAYDNQGNPLDADAARGVAVLQVPGDAKRYRYDLFPDVTQNGKADSLAVAVDLRKFAGTTVGIELQIVGLPGAPNEPLRAVAKVAVPRTKEQRVAAVIAEQKVCPVSGEQLGSMGDPIAVTVGEQDLYVCCQGCVAAVKADPEKYLAMVIGGSNSVPPGEGEVRPGVFKVTAVDRPFVESQKLCPVMDEPLGDMGSPYRVEVEDQAVYICCPGCAKKLQANPKVYLEKLAGQGVKPPAVR